ncbi:MAG: hypothetical protein ACREPM_24750, partial [Gemmatimonadaceae bacterium]
LVLTVTFVVGGFAGAALERHLVSPQRAERRIAPAGMENNIERIPQPLEDLALTDSETAQLRAIARRWRPQSAVALDEFRGCVNDMENGMFAEMLCAISPAKRQRYLEGLRAAHYDAAIIAKRFELVTLNRCVRAR